MKRIVLFLIVAILLLTSCTISPPFIIREGVSTKEIAMLLSDTYTLVSVDRVDEIEGYKAFGYAAIYEDSGMFILHVTRFRKVFLARMAFEGVTLVKHGLKLKSFSEGISWGKAEYGDDLMYTVVLWSEKWLITISGFKKTVKSVAKILIERIESMVS